VKDATQRTRKKWTLTRIENWVGAGIPDLLICDDKGLFHLIELKFTKSNRVELRPTQVSWLTKHQHSSSWILIKKQNKPTDKAECLLYPASSAVDLKMEGISKVEPLFRCQQPFCWEEIFSLISLT